MSQPSSQLEPDLRAAQQQPAVRDVIATSPAPDAAASAPIPQADPDAKKEQSSSGAFSGIRDWYTSHLKAGRYKAIQAMPAFVVNNSSNVLGAAHVGTEMMMFKSAMPPGVNLVKNHKNPVSWIVDPFKTVYTETFHAARAEKLSELFKGNVGKNVWNRITDMEAAAERYRARPEFTGKLGNPWQFRTTGIGLVTWSLSALIPEKKESDDEIERMSIKAKTNPIGYTVERVKQALWAPEWHKHKRQMIGLGMLASGVASTIGAWRGRGAGGAHYTFNRSYLATSLITFASGFPLLLATDEQRAYGNFGNVMLGRIAFLPTSISNKYATKDPGAHMYMLSSVSFQIENLLQTLIGGAEKKVLPDGTVQIIDHDAIRKDAQEKATLIKEGKLQDRNRDGIPDTPGTIVRAGIQSEKAMPERAEAQQHGA